MCEFYSDMILLYIIRVQNFWPFCLTERRMSTLAATCCILYPMQSAQMCNLLFIPAGSGKAHCNALTSESEHYMT